MSTVICTNCGALIDGTRFCVSCGSAAPEPGSAVAVEQPALAPPPAPPASSGPVAQAARAVLSTPKRIRIASLSLAGGVVLASVFPPFVGDLIRNANYSFSYDDYESYDAIYGAAAAAQNILTILLALAVAVVAAALALVSDAVQPRRTVSVVLAGVYVLLSIPVMLAGSYSYAGIALGYLPLTAIFFSWALGRQLKPQAYWAALIGVPILFIATLLTGWLYGGMWLGSFVALVLFGGAVAATVAIALALHKAALQPRAIAPQYSQATEVAGYAPASVGTAAFAQGQPVVIPAITPAGYKDLGTAYILLMFFGGLGVHRFYLGNVGMGVLYLLTFGLLGIGTFVDIFLLTSATRNANARIAYRGY